MKVLFAHVLLVAVIGVSPIAPLICDALCAQPVSESSTSHCTLHEQRDPNSVTLEAVVPDCDIVHDATLATKTASTTTKTGLVVSRVVLSNTTLVTRAHTLPLITHAPPSRTLLSLRI